nr:MULTISPECIES: FAD-dependent oxidoreductase [Microbacterium]
MADVAVVGGGIAGLVVAWELARAGARVIVCEADATAGGMLRSGRIAGVEVDLGAESFATRTTGVADLVADAALPLELTAPRAGGAQLAVPAREIPASDGPAREVPASDVSAPAGAVERHPLPRRAVAGLPADPAADDVARIIGAAGVARALQERALPLPADLAAAEPSLAELARTRYGSAVAERLVDPLCRSVHSRPASALRLSAVAPNLWAEFLRRGSLTAAVDALAPAERAGAAIGGIAGGMWCLADALRTAAERAGAVVRTQTPVREIRSTGAGAVLTLDGGAIVARHVVLATGPAAAGRLLGHEVAAEPVRLVTVAVVHPGLTAHPVGSGVIVAPGVPVDAKALTHANAKWAWLDAALNPDTHILRLSARDAGTGLRTHDEVATALRALTGVPVQATDIRALVETRWDDAVPAPGDGPTPTEALTAAALARGIHLTGAIAAGTGLASVIPHARALARELIAATTPVPAPHAL